MEEQLFLKYPLQLELFYQEFTVMTINRDYSHPAIKNNSKKELSHEKHTLHTRLLEK